jgi:hypothetical protein
MFTSTTDGDRTDCSLEDELKEAEQYCRDCPDRFGKHIPMQSILEMSKDSALSAISKSIPN